MAYFLTASGTNLALEKLINDAENQLVLVSPFIKLHDRLKDALRRKADQYNLTINLLFGKNESSKDQSLNANDLIFFMEFPNISISYKKNLHAKYYANEKEGIVTSMNLYDYSQNSNIEVGIQCYHNLQGRITGTIANQFTGGEDVGIKAWQYFTDLIKHADVLFKREPQFENTLLGLKKKYTGSIITANKLGNTSTTSRIGYENKKSERGYCIRCKHPIMLNIQKPYCDKCYSSWNQYKNPNYKEKYCHVTGMQSLGSTTMQSPVIKKAG
jgi:hypothetical protein